MVLLTPLKSADLAVLHELQTWVLNTVSVPYPGTGFSRPGKPVCPYTRAAVADGAVVFALAEDVDGSDEPSLDLAMHRALDWFLANVDRDQFLFSLVTGFPSVPHTSNAIDVALDRMTEKRRSNFVIATGCFQDNVKSPQDLEYPDGIPVPVAALVLRYLSPFDSRFLDQSEGLLKSFMIRFAAEIDANTLPRASRNAVLAGCQSFGLPVPAGLR